ncbi:MAG: hypothetical protein RLP02_30055 [Coleofasciculus sp. C2-GNP5-27]
MNDGQDTAPSQRIIDQFPAYEKAKVTEGSQVAELKGLPLGFGISTITPRCNS